MGTAEQVYNLTPTGHVDDLTNLAHLDENILLQEIKFRYGVDKIYTYVGDILLAVNPYKDPGIYDKKYLQSYQRVTRSMLPPHIYAVADAAYQALMGMSGLKAQDQCILISGESGAGKTESTKLLLRALVEQSRGDRQLEMQLLMVNPLMEAFGNAQTVMNDNSSRFGKYIQLHFLEGNQHHWKVQGARVSEYLLEKSRVSRQNPGERNFHIFYLMFAGLGTDELQKLGLSPQHEYSYLMEGNTPNDANILESYERLRDSMDIVGFTNEEQSDIFVILAAVLSLGNVRFQCDGGESAEIANNDQALGNTARVLGLDRADLAQCLTSRQQITRGEVFNVQYNEVMAKDVRDAIAKVLYGRLFGWIVNKINTLLAAPLTSVRHNILDIGLLDIFGFEQLGVNSFEQMCINLANEQLQYFFNLHIFHLEQEEYKKEGVEWRDISFIDNRPLLDLFLNKPIGVISILDEESHFPRATDVSFVNKMIENFEKKSYFNRPAGCTQTNFVISHYAGQVLYDVTGWLEKNRDSLPPGALQLLRVAENELLGLLFKAEISRTGTLSLQKRRSRTKSTTSQMSEGGTMNMGTATRRRQAKPTVATQFKNSLAILMERLNMSNPHFVRCVRPNEHKKPNLFNDQLVLQQLRYTGMLETTRIRREGFAIRPTFEDFISKFGVLLGRTGMTPTADNCRVILEKAGLTDYRIGKKSKVFLRARHTEQLQQHLWRMSAAATHIQRMVRGFLARRRVAQMRRDAHKQEVVVSQFLVTIPMKSQSLQSNLQQCEDRTIQSPTSPGIGLQSPNLSVAGLNIAQEVEEDTDDTVLEDDFVAIAGSDLRRFGREGTVAATIAWFRETQAAKLLEGRSELPRWFHGIISRRHAEQLLVSCPLGDFLIRVSESRFGYSLSFRAEDRCRHYMITQTRSGKYIINGEPKVHVTLDALVKYHQKFRLSNYPRVLMQPCGQLQGHCDYGELVADGVQLPGGTTSVFQAPQPSAAQAPAPQAQHYPLAPPGGRASVTSAAAPRGAAPLSAAQPTYSTSFGVRHGLQQGVAPPPTHPAHSPALPPRK